MPLNVCDPLGRHLGFVYKAFPFDKNVLLVALTSLTIDDCIVNQQRIISFLASVYNAKNLFGKINEEELRQAIENQLWEAGGGSCRTLGIRNDDEYLRLLYLQHYSDWSVRAAHSEDFRHVVEAPLSKENALGFVLLDIRHTLQVKDGAIVLDAELDYLKQETFNGLPLFARIHKYPVIRTERVHLVEGDRHIHLTTIPYTSGNSVQVLEVQQLVYAAKGMNLQIYFEGNAIKRILAGGTVFELEEL